MLRNPVTKLSILLLIASGVWFVPTFAPAQQQFSGRLQPKLLAYDGFGLVPLTVATPQDLAKFVHRPSPDADVRTGTLEIGDSNDLKFAAALVKIPGQPACAYIDRNHSGRFTEKDRTCFHAMPTGAASAIGAEISLPLPRGPYGSFPIELSLPLSSQTDPHNGKAPTLLATNRAFVRGSVRLPDRVLPVGYMYDVETGSADPTKCLQFADMNGDGKIDLNDERDMGEDGVAPVFHIGQQYLRTTSVNLATRRVKMTSVPAEQYQRFDLWQGATVPDFSFKTLDGKTMKLSDIKGRVVLLDFWAAWCEPCVADLPSKKAIYAKYHARGFEILGMDGDADAEAAEHVVAKLGLPWTQGRPSGALIRKRFHVTMWPMEILLDEHGHVLDRGTADLFGDHLATTLDRVLGTQ